MEHGSYRPQETTARHVLDSRLRGAQRSIAGNHNTVTDQHFAVRPATINWSGGVAPYALIASPNPVTVIDIVRVYINITGNSFDWTPDFDTQTYVFLSLSDSTGAVGRSGGFILSASNDTSCLRSQTTTTSSSPGATSITEKGESASSPSAGTSSRGLNGGAIAGIVVGCLVAAAALAFLALWISRKRAQAARKRARASRSRTS